MTKITEKQKAEYEARRKMLRLQNKESIPGVRGPRPAKYSTGGTVSGMRRATLKLIKGKPKLAKKGW